MERWKTALIGIVCLSLGVVVGIGSVLGVQNGRSNRGGSASVWDTKAFTAKYTAIDVDPSSKILVYYAITNNTEKDYTSPSGAFLSQEAHLPGGTFHLCDDCMSLPTIFIPPHDTAEVVVTMNYVYPGGYTAWNDPKASDAHAALKKFMNTELGRADGFTLLDKTNRYRIDLPGGWK